MKNITPPEGGRKGCAPRNSEPSTRRIDYAFTPTPFAAIVALKEKRIGHRALALLSYLVGLRQPGGWAWSSNSHLARELGCSTDTVTRACSQLSKAGLIERHRVPSPDPDDKANRTGWRFRFLFVDAPSAAMKAPHASEVRNRAASTMDAPSAAVRTNP